MAIMKVKTWQRAYRQVTLADKPPAQVGQTNFSPGHRANMWAIKTLLLGAGWTVVGSCGYVGAAWASGMDGVDRWPDVVAVRWKETTGGYFSWIVLRQTAINASGQGYQICIACNATVNSTNYMTLVDSWGGGFVGGSTTTRPTASDEQVILDKGEYAYYRSAVYSSTYGTTGIHCLWTTDHTMTRIIMSQHEGAEHYLNYVWCFELGAVAGRRAWWDKPYIATVAGAYYRAETYSVGGGQTDALDRMVTRVGDYKVMVANTSETTGFENNYYERAALGQLDYAQTVDGGGDWIATRIGVSAFGAIAGWFGRREDLWFIPEAMATGEYLPTATFDFFVYGDLLLPNDGNPVPID